MIDGQTNKPEQKNRIILAPMQGLVDDVMRDLLTRIGGYDECVSEFVRITHTVHSHATWLKYVPEIANGNKTPVGTPCTVQLLGSDADNMAANALEAVRFGADKIDLNFGCPAPTVNKHKGGAILLKEPQLIFHIVKTLRERLPAHIPLTAKMRLGYEDKSRALECACAIAEGGACGLTVHARTKAEAYEPPAHWEWIKKNPRCRQYSRYRQRRRFQPAGLYRHQNRQRLQQRDAGARRGHPPGFGAPNQAV